jgi:hypothetical protein
LGWAEVLLFSISAHLQRGTFGEYPGMVERKIRIKKQELIQFVE